MVFLLTGAPRVVLGSLCRGSASESRSLYVRPTRLLNSILRDYVCTSWAGGLQCRSIRGGVDGDGEEEKKD